MKKRSRKYFLTPQALLAMIRTSVQLDKDAPGVLQLPRTCTVGRPSKVGTCRTKVLMVYARGIFVHFYPKVSPLNNPPSKYPLSRYSSGFRLRECG
ncbi:hypothetical protein ES708_22447 [subsurface metagenome]